MDNIDTSLDLLHSDDDGDDGNGDQVNTSDGPLELREKQKVTFPLFGLSKSERV